VNALIGFNKNQNKTNIKIFFNEKLKYFLEGFDGHSSELISIVLATIFDFLYSSIGSIDAKSDSFT
jgi:hypothetical protein